MELSIKVPMMGESVSTATVSSLLVENGAIISAGQEIIELETDKVNQVLSAEKGGKVLFSVAVGDTVAVGDKLGYIEVDEKENTVSSPVLPGKKEEQLPKSMSEGARKTTQDFLANLEQEEKKEKQSFPTPSLSVSSKTEEPGVSRKKMTSLRKTIASRLVEVKNKTAMLTTFNEVDMSAVMEVRNKEKESFQDRYEVKLGFMSFFVKAATVALKAYPLLNSYIEGEEIVTVHSYDIGVAVSTDKGLFVPVIKNCQNKSFGEIEKEIVFQAKKAREGTIAIEDLQGGTFTITNGGVFGSLLSTPILNPPQSAILGMHSIVKRPIAIGDLVEVRPMMYLALSYDHRIIDGKEAVLFLKNIKESLEDPSRFLLDL